MYPAFFGNCCVLISNTMETEMKNKGEERKKRKRGGKKLKGKEGIK